MRRIVSLVLLFAVVLFFIVFLGLNWGTRFELKLGFGSQDAQVSIIAWTLGSFAVGAVCTAIIFATNLLKRGRKTKEPAAKKPETEETRKEYAE